MEISIYFSHSFVNEKFPINKIGGQGELAYVDDKTETTTLAMIKNGLTSRVIN